MNKTQYTNHRAADFINAAGEHILSLQLLNQNNQAIAIADLRNGKIERFDSARACLEYARGEWLRMVLKLYGYQAGFTTDPPGSSFLKESFRAHTTSTQSVALSDAFAL
jgi:hypothetical protein